MKKLVQSLFILLFVALNAIAQERTVTGVVTSAEDGLPLPGVSVRVKGGTASTQTNANGQYSISVPSATSILIFSFIGTETKELPASTAKAVALSTDNKQLSEVIVTGYNTQNKRTVAGSVATVGSQDLERVPIASFDQALQGKAPGILVQAQSGQPGAAASVVIRGKGSIVGSNAPLYLVDGMEISNADFATLNTADFESVSILKDAVSTSQYGSRGANGVVVITTKKGKSGKVRLSYDTQYGFSQAPQNKLRVMNTEEKLRYEVDIAGNVYDWTPADLEDLRQINTNWEDVFFRTGQTQTHQLSASGGSEKTTYFLSGSIFDQTGTVINTGLKRYTGRANLESTAGDFKFGINTTLGYSDFSNTSENDAVISSPLNAIRWSNPYEKPYQDDGSYTQIFSGQPNALQELLENNNLRQQLKGVGNIYINYDAPFLKGLSFRTNWGGDYTSNENTTYADPTTNLGSGPATIGRAGSLFRGYTRSFRYTGTNSITYKTTINTDHDLSVGIYNEVVNRRSRGFSFSGFGLRGAFENEAGITPGNTTNGFIPLVGGTGTENALVSYFGNAQYGYKNKLFVDGWVRRDGSSRFGSANKYANFGSVGLSWILTEENFMSSLKESNIFNELKFKASYGSSGNQALTNDFAAYELYNRSVYNGIGGLVQVSLENPNLRWERRTTFNTGIEFATLNGRLRVTAEYYDAITSDLFLNRQLSRTSGFNFLNTNIGKLQNKGFEFFLDGDLIKTKDFTWNANLSLTFNKNRIKELVTPGEDIENGIYITRVGESINTIYLVRYAGVDPNNGKPQFLTKDGAITNTYDPNDRVTVGSVEAPFFGGFGTGFKYKNLELNAFFSFVAGNEVYNNDRVNLENPQYVFDNLAAVMLTAWQNPGDITQIPDPSLAWFNDNTTRMVESGDFLRLRNVNLFYTLPKSISNKIKSNNVRLFVQGQNLVTWTKFQGFDPEISTGILTGAQYPALRTVTFGLNVGF
ncbi:SusC/RagA family TonB-linked outer membrane protein [Pedobacter puniceum]|jgi:TonB-linked SusC/RagA family outer membrane protein|uniref:SusC/RagA family TonB-linked outer membrane protein n=1 Tax=Pedobacter puniceum TaxID=2666136 RepID=A0A7K0FRA1_9SPHI|nr:TonB-dependent receptor [Pedobacter puniceum]MRX48529.1 SusC/RagA family TonB-linked outer membrane protein [Pedobacter puniceum]